MADQGGAYNAPDFSIKLPDPARLGETIPVRVGEMAPEFEAPVLDGEVVRLRDLREQCHVVLMMGSITSPMCAVAMPGMNQMVTDFGGRGVNFYLVYVKESHPGEHYLHHTSMEQKLSHARDFRKAENVKFPILVDSLEGTIHRSYGPWPTSLFVIHRDGRLVYRSTIADPQDARHYLAELLASDHLSANPDRVPHLCYSERLIEHEPDQVQHRRVYDRAGPKAFEDYWKQFPGQRGRWP